MAYQGYGYPGYPYSPRRQNTNSYSTRQAPEPPTTGTPQVPFRNNNRDYGQPNYDWNGRDLSNLVANTQPAGNNYWLSQNDTQNLPPKQPQNQSQSHSQTLGYQPQMNYVSSELNRASTSEQFRQGSQPSNNTPYSSGAGSKDSNLTNDSSVYYQHNTRPQDRHHSPAEVSFPYQSNSASASIGKLGRPDSAQSSRNVAASAMTALSTTPLSRPPFSQTISNRPPAKHSHSPQIPPSSNLTAATDQLANAPNYTSAISTAVPVVPQTTSPQIHRQEGPSVSTAPSTSNYPHQIPKSSSTSGSIPRRTNSESRMSNHCPEYPSNVAASHRQYKQCPPLSNDIPSNTSTTESDTVAVSTSSSLPTFVDPSQIYNPYHKEYEQNKAAEIAKAAADAEAKKQQKQTQAVTHQPQTHVQRRGTLSTPIEDSVAARQTPDSHGEALTTSQNQSAPISAPAQKQQKPKSSEEKLVKKRTQQRKSESGKGRRGRVSPRKPATEEASLQKQAAAPGIDDVKRLLESLKANDPGFLKKLLSDVDTSENKADVPQPSQSQPPQPSDQTTSNQVQKTDTPVSESTPAAINSTEATVFPDLGKFPAARRKRRRSKFPSQVETLELPSKAAATLSGETPRSTAEIQPLRTNPDLNKVDQGGERKNVESPVSKDQKQNRPQIETGELDLSERHSNNLRTDEQQRQTILSDFIKPKQPPKEKEIPKDSDLKDQLQPQPPEPIKETEAKSFWPHSRRQALAEAACGYISSLPENETKSITAAFLLSLIQQNPSYLQLCEMLESRGFLLNRVHFAKHLLKAMPDLNESSQSPKVEPKPTPQIVKPNVPRSSFVSSTPTSPISNTNHAHPQPNTTATLDQPVVHSNQTSPPLPATTNQARGSFHDSSTPSSTTASGQPAESAPPGIPGYSSPYPAMGTSYRAGSVPSYMPEQSQLARANPSSIRHATKKLDPKLRVPSAPIHQPAPDSKEARARKRTFGEIVDLTQIISDNEDEDEDKDDQHVDKIARVNAPPANNISSADAPDTTAEAENESQASLPKTMDLSKFKFVGTPGHANKEKLRRRNDLVKSLNKAKALRKSYYDPRTIARDILIAAGRHPTELALNHHLMKLREKFHNIEYNSDLETIRWDIIDPGGPPPPEVPSMPLITRPELPSRDIFGSLHNIESHGQASTTPKQQHPHPSSQLRISHSLGDEAEEMKPNIQDSLVTSTPPIPGKRRAGRPPGAKNKPKLGGATPSKKKALEVVVPRDSSKAPASYHEYQCLWNNCGSKLHNLETFRKHILKLHLPKDDGIKPCSWDGCGSTDSDEKLKGKLFTSSELQYHLDNVHLRPLAWKLGDGPTSIGSGFQSIDYDSFLHDENGRALIPKANTDGVQPTLIFPAAYRSIREFNNIHGHKSDRSKALEVMRSLETKQARVGVGLGRGGCTLMNPTRLDTVASFENVFKII